MTEKVANLIYRFSCFVGVVYILYALPEQESLIEVVWHGFAGVILAILYSNRLFDREWKKSLV